MSATNDDQKQKDWQRIAQEAEQDVEQPTPCRADDDDDDEQEKPASAASGQLDHPSYQALEDKLTATEMKMHEYWDQAMRLKAELDNLQRRAQRNVEDAHKYALKDFSAELIPVIDSLEQALQLQVDDHAMAQQIHEGIELTQKLFLAVLQKFGVEQLNPVGETFDPERHEAMAMQAQEGVAANTILTVFQKGYLLNERVIRPARVVVAK